jgi:hypothetical protein
MITTLFSNRMQFTSEKYFMQNEILFKLIEIYIELKKVRCVCVCMLVNLIIYLIQIWTMRTLGQCLIASLTTATALLRLEFVKLTRHNPANRYIAHCFLNHPDSYMK